MRNYIFSVCLGLVSTYAIASTSVNIKVNFSGESIPNTINRAIVESVDMSCSGKVTTDYPSGYMYNGSSYDGKGELKLSISGPFSGDYRHDCEIDSNNGKEDVYFILNNLVISYNRNNILYKCYIKGTVGTSSNFNTASSDKLQAQYEKVAKPCAADGSNNDTFTIIPGGGYPNYDPGKITINLK